METIKVRKVMMAVAKYITVFTLLFLFHLNPAVAQKLEGEYHANDGSIYKFNDNSFMITTPLHFANKKLERGNFKIDEGTLFLNFNPTKNHPKAGLKFIEKEPISNIVKGDTLLQDTTIYVHFDIVGGNNKPIKPNPILLVKNKQNQTIQGFSADSLGQIPEIFIFGSFEGYFHFTSLANEELKIQGDTLSGYKSNVKVTLPERATYSKFDGNKSFLIQKWEEDRIVLKNLNENQKIVLSKKNECTV